MDRAALVLGGTGMVGNCAVAALRHRGIQVRATARLPGPASELVNAPFDGFDALADDIAPLVAGYGPGDVVVNCIGVLKQAIDEESIENRLEAIRVNAGLPNELAELAARQGFHVIHITTDCVFSGRRGNYVETDEHDESDVYGRTKSLGEVPHPSVTNLRCSMIGEELRGFHSFLEWVLSQPAGGEITGYTDHLWNGVTAPALAQVISAMVESGHLPSGTIHLVPADTVSKAELCVLSLNAYGRSDVAVTPKATGNIVNRILGTVHEAIGARLWRDAGYAEAPSIEEMVMKMPSENRITGARQ